MIDKTKSRDTLIDALKGFTIILVVLGHAIQFNDNNFQNSAGFTLIYTFHMPLFMFLSGYVAFYSISRNSLKNSISKRIVGLLIPWISWAFLFPLIIAQMNLENVIPFAKSITKGLDNTLWFLFILFISQIILIFITKLTASNKRIEIITILITSVVLYLLPFTALSFHQLQHYFPFVALGYLVSKHKDFLKPYYTYFREGAIILFVFMFFLYFHQYLVEPIANSSKVGNVWKTFYMDLKALTGIAICFIIFKELRISWLQSFFIWIGKYTLDIYAIHSYAISVFAIGVYNLNNPLAISANTVLLIAISILFSNLILRKSKILKFLFLGQYDKKNSAA